VGSGVPDVSKIYSLMLVDVHLIGGNQYIDRMGVDKYPEIGGQGFMLAGGKMQF
jgi:hypothetical protein